MYVKITKKKRIMNIKNIPVKYILGIYDPLKVRLEEPDVISVSSQVFTTQTIDAKDTFVLDYCSFKLNQSVSFTY